MQHPSAFPRRILVATLGLAPQVLTETLYALAHEKRAFIPTEIHVITTEQGHKAAERDLLHEPRLAQFAADFDLPLIATALTPERIHVLRHARGDTLADITSQEDNLAAANQITALMRELTSDAEASLHVSLAGGRKTMGFLLGYALSLYARGQDRLSHVLVDAPLETEPRFFYPRPGVDVIYGRDGQGVSVALARVSLAEIPFVRLREGLPEALLHGDASYAHAVDAVQARFNPPSMVLVAQEGRAVLHGVELALSGAEFAFLMMLARRLVSGLEHGGALHWTEVRSADFLLEYNMLPHPVDRVIEALSGGVTKEWFEQRVTRLRAVLRRELGALAGPYLPVRVGARPTTRIGLGLPAEVVEIIEGEPAS